MAVAVALQVPQAPGKSVRESLSSVLARQQLLVVLDNCEHVAGAAAELCEVLLAAADDVRVLATSRAPLEVAGESRYRLPPLALPGGTDGGAARRGTGRWRRRWSGVTSCSARMSSVPFAGWRCSPARSRWRLRTPWRERAGERRCCGWWTARCSCRLGRGRMAGPAIRCWRRCAPTGLTGWTSPGASLGPLPR
ncbi:MAG: hypothetical protein ABSA03_04545 [Streptosporangiaceae bacterium]